MAENISMSIIFDAETIERAKETAAKHDMKLAEYIRQAVNAQIVIDDVLDDGGLHMTVPNPKNFYLKNGDAEQIVTTLSNASAILNGISPGCDFGLSGLVKFAVNRLLEVPEMAVTEYRTLERRGGDE